jgi:hypothetical protein
VAEGAFFKVGSWALADGNDSAVAVGSLFAVDVRMSLVTGSLAALAGARGAVGTDVLIIWPRSRTLAPSRRHPQDQPTKKTKQPNLSST